jgi:hypothetical protein
MQTLLTVGILFRLLFYLKRKYHVRVTRSKLEFGYSSSLTAMVIERSKIQSVEVKPHINGLWEWGGWGIRMNTSCKYEIGNRNGVIPSIGIMMDHLQVSRLTADNPM